MALKKKKKYIYIYIYIHIHIFVLKNLNDIVINFSLHNNRSYSPWFLSNQCWATSYDHSLYYQIGISTISLKGLIHYYVDSWKTKTFWVISSHKRSRDFTSQSLRRRVCPSGTKELLDYLPFDFNVLFGTSPNRLLLLISLFSCQANTLRLKLLSIVKTYNKFTLIRGATNSALLTCSFA